jgi:integrase
LSVRKGNTLTSKSTVAEALELWRQDIDRPDYSAGRALSESTKKQYRDAARRHLQGSELAAMSLAEANNAGTLERFLRAVATDHGDGAMRLTRKVVNGLFQLALSDGAIERRASKDLAPIRGGKEHQTKLDYGRAYSKDEVDSLKAYCDASEFAARLDLADLVAFGIGTGARISEALRVRWDQVDLEAGVVLIDGTKSRAAKGVVPMGPSLTTRLKARAEARGRDGLIFPNVGRHPSSVIDKSKPRDRRNVTKHIRALLNDAGFEWARFHTSRHTAATSYLLAGGTPLEAQALLRHGDSRTLDRYVDSSQAVARIDRDKLL